MAHTSNDENMFRIFEKYLEKIGERRGLLLLGSILIWVSILLAIYAYGIGMGGIAVWRITQGAYWAISEILTDRVYDGNPWPIFMGGRLDSADYPDLSGARCR